MAQISHLCTQETEAGGFQANLGYKSNETETDRQKQGRR